ncbi:MAG: protein translocase subunit SecD [Acidobacteriota bacterium]
MNKELLGRGAVILAIVGLFAFAAFPLDQKIKRGLDLSGGIHLVLEVVTEDALRAETDTDIGRLTREMEDNGITGLIGESTGDSSFLLRGLNASNDGALRDVVRDFLPNWTYSRNADGVSFSRRDAADSEIRESAVNQAVQTIRNRIDEFGVAEPVIARQGLGTNRIVVQLPGVDDPERVKDTIKSTAFLEFRLVDANGGPFDSRQALLAMYGGSLPPDVEIFEEDVRDETTGVVLDTLYYGLEARSMITGRDLKDARPSLGEFNAPVVSFSLGADSAARFGELTSSNIGRAMAIVLDGKVQSAPVIQGRITDQGQISGSFTQQEVDDLSLVLRSGALPAEIKYLEERTVGPSLGQDSIEQGLQAGMWGVILVVCTMLLVYKLTGVNAVIALAFNFILVFGALAYFGATLTLPGVAGLILTIGMAVDANVLVFERIREELRAGKTVKAAVASGFANALSSVLDANITTLIAAVFLFQFGTGPIRGFAVTLSIGILASVFTAIINSRFLFDVILNRKGRVENLSI